MATSSINITEMSEDELAIVNGGVLAGPAALTAAAAVVTLWGAAFKIGYDIGKDIGKAIFD
jgi:lactobin A/cerein 7B family class IIb bacteriocin